MSTSSPEPVQAQETGPGKSRPRKHFVRDNLEAVSLAIVLALLLKYFVIEAYQIPTSSMQPTLLGSRATGIHDRILVDKLSYTFKEPRRFDVSVFRYPLNTSQNYVKRIWGLGGETLKVVAGNVYRKREGDGDGAVLFEALRKPDRVQDGLWKLLYDTDRTEMGGSPIRPESDWITRSARGTWRATRDRGFHLDLPLEGSGQATFRGDAGGGDRLRNHYWHGYPASIEEDIKRFESPHGSGSWPVQDLRLSLRARPGPGIETLSLAIRMVQEVGGHRSFRLEVGPEGGRLLAEMARQPEREVAAFSTGLRPGRPVRISLAHVDDQLVALVDGRETARYAYVPASLELTRQDPVELAFGARGRGEVEFSAIRIERDVHILATGIAEGGASFTVPPGHYWMLGDNSMASEDGRAWTQIAFKVGEGGRILPPGAEEPGRVLRGNRRPVPTSLPVDPDENPVVVAMKNRVVFTDNLGDRHVFPWDGTEWSPRLPPGVEASPAPFVRRDQVVGRALLIFWPANPLGTFRLGFIR